MSKKTGKMYFRSREEGYQKNQSPRQKMELISLCLWSKQLHVIELDTERTAQMEAD